MDGERARSEQGGGGERERQGGERGRADDRNGDVAAGGIHPVVGPADRELSEQDGESEQCQPPGRVTEPESEPGGDDGDDEGGAGVAAQEQRDGRAPGRHGLIVSLRAAGERERVGRRFFGFSGIVVRCRPLHGL
ncbi:hypothetical protein O159_15010 [Leifsonia xyli subsp. cynodontis DSM 46306]|uniref:Uncharacterized protein n=1 Tax=Leifsonia xyli subsp. cynodontis DSM 46306 TaxID=1389489 RepID=U3PDE0_LEIXC|nr:hypothetical protein O159_15010 [Leifsonia xyli subsp. cynodontis DSM 46306]